MVLLARRRACCSCLALLSAVLPSSAQVKVMAPDWLVSDFKKTEGRIEGSTATFGAPFYGDRVLGRLVYVESKGDMPYCSDESYEVPKPTEFPNSNFKSEQVRLIDIILVRRGKCSFTTKVKVAANKGAHAVLIVDREDSTLTVSDMKNIIVADDGFGGSIHIPSVLITKVDGNKLIEAVNRRDQVIVELAWDLPTNHVVQTDLWMSSGSAESNRFLKEFAPNRRVLNEVVIFQPHYAVFGMDGSSAALHNGLCYDSSGSFCAEDPDGPGPITGKMVLVEDVRQLCIHSVHQVKRETTYSLKAGIVGGVQYSEKYWHYLQKFMDTCPLNGKSESSRFGPECAVKLMRQVGIDEAKVQECMEQNTNKFLQDQREHPAWSPRALRINGWRYSGILDADLVTRAICSGFVAAPPECETLIKPRDPTVPFETKIQGITFKEMMGWFIALTAVIFILMMLYKRYLKKEMRSSLKEEVMLEVQAQMGEYTKMRGNG